MYWDTGNGAVDVQIAYSDRSNTGWAVHGNCDIRYMSWPFRVSMELLVQLRELHGNAGHE